MCNALYQYIILISDWVRKGTPIEAAWRRAVQQLNSCPHDDNEIWRMAITKIEEASSEKIKKIKDNPPKPIELDWNPEPHLQKKSRNNVWKKSTFDYVTTCDLIYNPPPCMIYTIPEEDEPISHCALESESTFNPNSNSNNDDDKNNGSSSAQYVNKNINNSDSDSNPEIYIVLSDLSKEQELK
ncbi:hypothetical protein G9A89_017470 [Geosiphon pyriformis]|nr:hypothetical protein G9A89_017470 [Geosiphon pyriformis]